MSAQPSITATRSRSKTAAQTTPQAQNQTQNHAKLIGKPKEQDSKYEV